MARNSPYTNRNRITTTLFVQRRPRAARTLHRQVKSHCPQDRSTMQGLCSWGPFFCILFFGQAKKSMSKWLVILLTQTGIEQPETLFVRRRPRAAQECDEIKFRSKFLY